jgi:hypothetical protein
MTRYSYALRARALVAARRWFNVVVDSIRAPIRRPDVLVVTGDASPEKVREIEVRLRFLFTHAGRILNVRRAHRASALDYLRNTAVVAVDSRAVPAVALRHLRWVADLDYDTNMADGWALMDVGDALTRRRRRHAVAAARQTFMDHVQRLKADGPRPVYLFGTGPSLRLADQRSFADGTTVVCNTIVRDPELWHHLAPAFLAAGDAIYHFGHTPHAQAFRADSLRRLQESNGRTLFIYPAQFDVIVRAEFRDVEPLLVPVPYGEHTDMTVDLTKHFWLPQLENVLVTLLLPLGCTVSNDVRLWGFDGRAPTDSGFWANSDRHAYPELMQSLRDSHPAFFAEKTPKGNEVKYANRVHGDLLEERLSEAERRGFEFRMLHSSWTPTLQKRYCALAADPA